MNLGLTYEIILCIYVQIDEVRRLIGPQSGNLALYCSDACISRNLRARNWNVKKAAKMLKETLKWRSEYKPEELRWVYSLAISFKFWNVLLWLFLLRFMLLEGVVL